ncbi:MAG: PQQ-binding-like beta-propeller repeat protein, partial [Candidatus Poseidoniia archaeon]|nr:PQQ-binding-like beta-propeller repeat protein [Candidatus Poseidoniia archaeon]
MTAHPLFRLVLPGPVLCLAVPADGSLVAAGDREGNLTVAGPDGALRWQKQLGEGIHGLAVSRDGSRLVVGSKDCCLRMFTGDGELEWEQLLGKSVWSLAMDPFGNHLVTGTGDSVALFTDGGIMVWEYETSRAMVGVGIANSATRVISCGDEQLFCLDKEGGLQWQQRRDDSLWDAAISADGERVLLGGWDRSVHCLDGSGADRWNHLTGGYVRAVAVLDDGGALAGSHDGKLYRLSAEGELLDSRRPGGEITAIGAAEGLALVAVGTGSEVVAYALDTPTTGAPPQPETESNTESMFGFGMFGTPAPDTSGLEPATSMSSVATHTPRDSEGGE